MATFDPSIDRQPAVVFLDPARKAMIAIPGRTPIASSTTTTAVDVVEDDVSPGGVGTGTIVLAALAILAAGGTAYYLLRSR